MTRALMITYFRELYELSSHTNDSKDDDQIDVHLNLAQNEFVDASFIDRDGQKELITTSEVYDNIRTLFVTSSSLSLSSDTEIINSKYGDYPSDLRYKLAVRVQLTRTDTNPIQSWYIAKPLNPLSVHKYIYNSKNNPSISTPFFTVLSNKLYIISDIESTINTVKLDYIKEPAIITLGQDCELPDNTHFKIVERAVNIALKSSSIEPSDKLGMTIQEGRQ